MSGFNYNGSADTALRLIKRFGQQLPIKRTSATYDPVTGADTSPTNLTGTLDLVVLPYGKKNPAGLDDRLVEQMIEGRSRYMICAAKTASFQPDAEDVITMDGQDWNVDGCSPLSPAGVPVIYVVIATRQ